MLELEFHTVPKNIFIKEEDETQINLNLCRKELAEAGKCFSSREEMDVLTLSHECVSKSIKERDERDVTQQK